MSILRRRAKKAPHRPVELRCGDVVMSCPLRVCVMLCVVLLCENACCRSFFTSKEYRQRTITTPSYLSNIALHFVRAMQTRRGRAAQTFDVRSFDRSRHRGRPIAHTSSCFAERRSSFRENNAGRSRGRIGGLFGCGFGLWCAVFVNVCSAV